MRKSIIIKHIEDYWPTYGATICAVGLLVLATATIVEERRQGKICLDRGMVVAVTSAGAYCAAPDALERI